ncbi:MAG TPA: FecR domain-containing protein [Gemmatimonadaceae bacterium]|nr:FecR domain-containing protein [Gemmatimonadaceae bacterium]
MSDETSSTGPGTEGRSTDWEALARYLAGESTPDEAAAVREWLGAVPARAELVGTLERSVGRLAYRAPAELDVEAALRRVHARMDEPVVHALPAANRGTAPAAPRGRPVRTLLRAAGVVALLAGGAGMIWRATHQEIGVTSPRIIATQTYMTPVGGRDSVHLPDGTLALLGPDSRLTVGADFGQGSAAREVTLRGEAYFEVKHDEAHPFTVRAGDAAIRDIGTAFVVRTDDRGAVQVSVTDGVVALAPVAAGAAEQGVTLRKGDRGTLEAGARSAVAQPGAGSADDLAWASGRLVFREASLAQVRSDLRRWHGVELVVADSAIAGRHLTASFSGEPVGRVLDVIGLALGARIERRGDTAVVRAAPRTGNARAGAGVR